MKCTRRDRDPFQQFRASRVPEVLQYRGLREVLALRLLAVDALNGIDRTSLTVDGAITNSPLSGIKTAPILPIEAKPALNAAC
jgi:hypothetical protein